MTVVIAFAVNVLVGLAKTFAAMLTGSASMAAEAAHSWADVGVESFLLVADRRSKGAPTDDHPLGFGRESYVWSMFAAIGLFSAGAVVSVIRGVQELLHGEPGSDFTVAYVVLGVAFVLEGSPSPRPTGGPAGRRTRANARCSSTRWRPRTRRSVPCSPRTLRR